MRVTIDMFSGRPNPTWLISNQDAFGLIDRVPSAALPITNSPNPKLGYRGFIISDERNVSAWHGLTPAYRIAGPSPAEFGPEIAAEAAAIEDGEATDAALWLLNTAESFVPVEILYLAEREIKAPKQPLQTDASRLNLGLEPLILPACELQPTPFNPLFWTQYWIQPLNNCYNFASNYVSNTMAQPGRLSGTLYRAFTCEEIGAAAARDGCDESCTTPSKLVALAVWPGFDFHWYRKQANGFWAHKPGPNIPINVDGAGRTITGAITPENCDRGPYTEFCGYKFSRLGMRVF